MAGCSEFLLVVSSLFVLVGATVPYKTAYLEQDLDHFNFVQANKVTFKQRYLYTGKALTVVSDTDGALEVKLHDVVHFVAEPGKILSLLFKAFLSIFLKFTFCEIA